MNSVVIRSILLLLWAFASISAAGQNQIISGYVLDAYTRQPVPNGTNVALKDSVLLGSTFLKPTNPYNGYFELRIDSKFDSLILSKPGYQSNSIPITDSTGQIPDETLLLRRVINLDMELNQGRVAFGVTITRKLRYIGGKDSTQLLLSKRQPLREMRLAQHVQAEADTLIVAHESYEILKISLTEKFKTLSPLARDQYKPKFTLNPIVKPFYDKGIATAGKRDQSISEIPASVVLINHEEIAAQGYQSVPEILENVTGLYLFRDYSWSGGDPIIGMRGFFSPGFNNDLIILVNGVNQYQDYWGFYPFASFPIPVEAIDRIEIVRGPMSVIYGSGAFFGVINIITNEASEQAEDSQSPKFVTIARGSRNTTRMSGGLEFNRDKVNFSFNGQLFDTDGIDQPFSRFLNDSVNTTQTTKGKLFSKQRYINLSLGLKDPTEQLQTNIDIVNSSENRGIFESTVSSSNDFCRCPLPQANPNATGSVNRTTSTYGAFQLNFNPTNTNINYSTRLNFYNYRTAIDYNAGGNRFGLSSFASRAFEGEVSASNDWEQQGLSGIVGINLRRADDLVTTFDIPSSSFIDGNNYIALDNDSHLTLFSAFSEFNFTLIKNQNLLSATGFPTARLAFTGGLRIEELTNFSYISNPSIDSLNNLAIPPDRTDLNRINPVLIPRGALVYTINRFNHLKLLYGQARKRPSFGNYTDNGALRFPTIQTIEFNFIREDHRVNAGDQLKVRLNASFFLNRIEDLITRVSTVDAGGNSIFQSGNEKSVNTLGGEMGVFLNYQKWKVEISGSINRSRETQTLREDIIVTGETPSYSPVFLGYLQASYPITFSKMELTTGLNARYISGVVPGFALGDANLPSRIGQDISGYAVTNLNLRLTRDTKIQDPKKFFDHYFITLNIRNLFNTAIQYPSTGNNSAWAEKGSAGYGIRWQVSFGIDI